MKTKLLLVALLGLILTFLAPLHAQEVTAPIQGSTNVDTLTVQVSDGGIAYIHFYCFVPELGSFKNLGVYWPDDKEWGSNTIHINLNENQNGMVFPTGKCFFDVMTANFDFVFGPTINIVSDDCTIWISPDELPKMVVTNGVVPLRWSWFARPGEKPTFKVCVKYRSMNCSTRPDFDPGNDEPVFGDSINWKVPPDAPQSGTYAFTITQIGRPRNVEQGIFVIDNKATVPVTLGFDPYSFPPDTGYFWLDMYPQDQNGQITLQSPPRFWVLEYSHPYWPDDLKWISFTPPLPTGSYQIGVPKDWVSFFFRAVEYRNTNYFPIPPQPE